MMRDLLNKLAGWLPRPAGRGRLELTELFHLFQAVLATNNQALEIITDMGEKLSGNYIFDTKYLQQAHQDLVSALSASIHSFTTLTRDQYPIAQAFERINDLIRAALAGQGLGSDLILALARIQWDRAREVGGKNYHLAELGNTLKLPVPDGFALTSRAFDEFIGHNELGSALERLALEPRPEDLAAIRERIMLGQLPPGLAQALDQAVAELKARHGAETLLAVRSSAEEEDDFFSFAGQFETVLNVALTPAAIAQAYRTVLASLFLPAAVDYQRQLGYSPGRLKMAVGCLCMVKAVASGVLYTVDPVSGAADRMLINAAWGYGPSVVDGTTDPDLFRLAKAEPPRLLATDIGRKETMTVGDPNSGTASRPTPENKRGLLCLSPDKAVELATYGQIIEAYFKGPQDVEWSLTGDGRLYLLQARPLTVVAKAGPSDREARPAPTGDQAILLRDQGLVVRQGVAGGKAFILKTMAELDHFPMGAVLVAEHDSPQFVRVMPKVAAIITDVGALASHMASVCREFKIPTLVNVGDATSRIRHGQEITVDCDDEGGATVYDGLVPEVLARRRQPGLSMDEVFEFRRKKYILRFISPLNLVNPLEDDFAPEKCRTLHDVLRFMHEKSIQAIIGASRQGTARDKLFQLSLPVPAVIQLVDLGGGVAPNAGRRIGMAEVSSLPLTAILTGMTHPGAWQAGGVNLTAKDLLTGIMRAPEVATQSGTEDNFAGASREYVNLGLRFGYHFNLLDSYCSERAANNHVYFRFVGGATDIVKRSRRLKMIELVLAEYGFLAKTKGDFLIARVSHIEQAEVLRILEMAGRLIAFTRQLDAELTNDEQIDLYAKRFLAGDFGG